MNRFLQVLICALVIIGVTSCKNSEKSTEPTAKAEVKKEKTAEVPETSSAAEPTKEVGTKNEQAQTRPSRPAPKYPDSLYFRIERTPCFGQCATYTVNIYSSGWAFMEGKQFFEYEGFFTSKFSEEELIQIENLATSYGYAKMEHVYDAPVTDLPSTTTVLQSENIHNWVYNRMNSPDELRSFEKDVESMIKNKTWNPSKKNDSKGDAPE